MSRIVSSHVEVYLFRRQGRAMRVLLLRRSPDRRKLPGVWQPVTGKREGRESAVRAAAREVLEETGLMPSAWWGLETVTLYYDHALEAPAVLPLFAAEVEPRARVVLSDEHDRHAWVSLGTAARRVLWESQRRALDALRREVLGRAPHARALAGALRLPPGRLPPRLRSVPGAAPRRRAR